jgi:nucleoside-diphosphate-sugar epimerase
MTARALVTGATGFIGSHLVDHLLDQGWDVACWCRPESRTERLEGRGVVLIRGKLDDHERLRRAVSGRDVIFHLAARIHSAPKELYEQVNHIFTRHLMDAALGEAGDSLRRFVYVSSIAAAGPSQPGTLKTEEDESSPISHYGRTKLRGEEAVRMKGGERLPYTIIRPPNVYGPRQKETELVMRLIRRRIVPVLKSHEPVTTLVYVKDLVRGILRAAQAVEAENQVFYMTDGETYSWREVIFTLRDILLGGKAYVPLPEAVIELAACLTEGLKRTRLVRVFFGRRAWESMTRTPWLFSTEKARSLLGFTPEYSLEQGLRATAAAGSDNR